MDSRLDTATPHAIHLRDYAPPAWLIDTVDLHVDLREEAATIRSTLAVRRNPASGNAAAALELDGQELELLAVRVDNRLLGPDDYTLTPERLTLAGLADHATVEITTRTRPQDNTALEGLYKSSGNYCTQCEAEGFRKITYFLDRPDVMARYTTTIEAERARYPVLLSNGNLTASGNSATEAGRHWARWEDPWPKPCYLFALVAGTLVHIEDRFTTRSGRDVALRIYVEPGNEAKCGHAMESLKKSMKWDEDVYGLEYDLDIFNIVAVSDFNMGAMENKSLNVFNTKYILAQPDTATDTDFLGIETVVAHEYFHNWTGNRVTCRDWFQLSLKEGLTVFRDQEFSADMNSAPVKRIQDVQRLRQVQFNEDAGPTAHSVRPESYIEISNFYTPTVYEKGAEVLRMYRTLLGHAGYRKGIDLYFARHDGQAVTTDDFLAAMVEANGQKPTDPLWAQFQRWYSQAGTPVVSGEGRHDAANGTYTLTLRQTVPATPGQPDKLPQVIPVALGLVGPDGKDVPLTLAGEGHAGDTTRIIPLTEAEQSYTFTGVPQAPVPSLLRGFSAPVRLDFKQDDAALTFLTAHDSDAFNRWEAGQTLATRLILADVDARAKGAETAVPRAYIDATAQTLARAGEDRAFAALALALPTEGYLGQQRATVDVDGIHAARLALRRTLARELNGAFRKAYDGNRTDGAFTITPDAMGRRALKNAALAYLMALDDAPARALCLAQYQGATTMTDAIAALALIADSAMDERAACLADFADRWKHEALVMDKWFAVQALSDRPDTLDRVRSLMDHPSFSIRNPNKVYALVGSFAGNPSKFHAADGSGYAFLADTVLTLDKLNPQVASRMVKPLARWRPYDSGRQEHAKAALGRIVGATGLSRDVYEIASKSLAG
ncbi:aminopeptidase N [Nitrospirillum viridazoti Y2]|uniref:Aminopeptidase N n=1 Tax=Nitrospirillum amazonense TaxID=28077 RepID=A0A560HZT1_9PROT|nr:aminopeptidase N [Nitrospirillum amazonense]EGY00093.1 aminopeptidase N [Nitrospirillum amazonense Y2]TWB52162.1 aminopeptidase N [Nitrospirillum amazonense]